MMKFLLFAVAVCIACVIAQPAPHQILTGAELMGKGFNALNGQSGLNPVIDMSYQFGQTWISPSGKTYSVPDQLTLTDQPESQTDVVEKMSASYSQIFNTYTSSFHFSVSVGVKAFSGSIKYNRELQKSFEELKNKTNMYGWSQHWMSVYQLVMPPAYVLKQSPMLRLSIMELPETISSPSDADKYREFVEAFGTHYLCIGIFGGHVHQSTFLDQSFESKYSKSVVTQQFSLMFHYMYYGISSGGFHNRSDIHFQTWFAKNAKAYSFFKGGDVALQSNATVKQWIQSVPDNAGLLNTTLCPITDLVPSAGTRQKTLMSYIKGYLGGSLF